MSKNNKSLETKWWFWFLVVIGIILIIIIFKQTMTSIFNTLEVSTNETRNIKNEYQLGEAFKNQDISIKFLSLNENFTNYFRYADIKSGYKIIKAEFEFENIGNTDFIASAYEFYCYADGYDCEKFWSVEDSGFSSSLSKGKKTKGSVYFEVPKESDNIVIEYELNLWTEERISFKVK